ncbi:MAG TPA: HAMP domain-containing sensor histidine kinase [Acetobacteraceae bacterium]|nr:HAMP domain-containing sensor histidine kinase [Acetobacteraceae bacterium]
MPDTPAPLRNSLSARLFRLTIGIVLAVEVLMFVPQLAHERLLWLNERLEDARIAALAASSDPSRAISPATTAQLLRLSDTIRIRMQQPGRPPVTLAGPDTPVPAATIVLSREGWMMRTVHALRALIQDRHDATRVLATSAPPRGTHIEFVYRAHQETKELRHFARDFVWVSLITACLTGATVYVVVWLLMVRPMRRIIASIAAFRAAPEHSRPLDPPRSGVLANDEMAVAARELSAMQNELRNALWRNARLAALGNAVARISHDLRGVLAPALLMAERLQNHSDETVQRAGDMLLRTVDRATDLVRRTLDFAREGPPPLKLEPVALAVLIDEASLTARRPGRGFAVQNHVPPDLLVHADRNQFFRVLANLLRNAADAGATCARVSAGAEHGMATIDVADNGPGLPDPVRATLFHPFTRSTRHEGAGLGLAIARDLTLAHGGEIALADTGPQGTVFRLTLRTMPLATGNGENSKGCGSDTVGIAPPAKADV